MADKPFVTTVEIKAVDPTQRLIDGWAAAIGNRDRQKDVIQPGAFDRTLLEKPDVVCFVGHDASRLPVGVPVEMRADGRGLFTRTKIYETRDGDDLLAVAKARLAEGKTLGMSIGFRTVKDRWHKAADGEMERHLLDVDLVEYSFLASPDLAANPHATVLSVKRRSRKAAGAAVTIEASYEDLIGDIEDAAAGALRVPMGCVRVVATYPDHAIVCCDRDGNVYMGQPDDDTEYWDFPYTLDDEGEPVLGDPKPVQPGFLPGANKAFAKPPDLNGYRVEMHGDRAVCIGPDGKQVDDHDTYAQARAHVRKLAKEKADMPPDQKAEWSSAQMNDLPDSAFAYIEPGGSKDDEGKTVPRSLRHFPHHGPGGGVDLPHLRNALARAPQSPFGDKAMAHLKRHAEAEGVGQENGKSLGGDAHSEEYVLGAAPAGLIIVEAKLAELRHAIVEAHVSMTNLGIDTKTGRRLQSAQLSRLKELITNLQEIAEWAEAVDRGDDGKAQIDWYRGALAVFELETAEV